MARLCAAGIQLREQIDDDYPDRNRKSDGWIADARHIAKGSSDHIPANGVVRALDIDADLSAHKEEAYALVEKIRKLAKKGFHKALIEDQKQSDVYWLCWEAIRRSGETVKPFGEQFLETLKSLLATNCSNSSVSNTLISSAMSK